MALPKKEKEVEESGNLGASAIMAGGSLIGGLLQQKAQAEEERKRRLQEAMNQELSMRSKAASDLAQGQRQSLAEMLAANQRALSL